MKIVNVLVPELPESINNATVIKWNKKIGDIIQQDEILLELETEKVILEIPSPINGILKKIIQQKGSIVTNKQILGCLSEDNTNIQYNNKLNLKKSQIKDSQFHLNNSYNEIQYSSPSVRRKIAQKNHLNDHLINDHKNNDYINGNIKDKKINSEERVPMTYVRKRIAQKLLDTTKKVAMLTTFNEVNMQSIINFRNKYRIEFEKKYSVRLGFMPFFVKSVVLSLKNFPIINSRIDGDDIIYYKNFNINIAISTDKGLITPILKNADCLSMPDIEKKIQSFILKSNTGKLKLSDLIGGNFTITNGGVFGSLFSTPIINSNQSAILGIHAIKDRVVVINNQVKIAPMLYLALSYDHRLIDGKEAVGFLNMIKNTLEDFSRIIIDI